MRLAAPIALSVVAAALAALTIAAPSHATFPGANGLIAFDDFSAGIDVVNPDGSGRRTLIAGADPSFSADGRSIAFQRENQLWVMNADGSGVRQITTEGQSFEPAFSPDGKKIVFVGARAGDSAFQIYAVNSDGSGETRLTNTQGLVSSPGFSPDGKQIVFALDAKINVMNADGSGITPLVGSGFFDGQPDFSPDGSRIVFATTYTDQSSGTDVLIMNANGQNAVQLTQTGASEGFVSQGPVFSPDGKKIVFASNQGGPQQLWTMNVDGTGQAPLTTPTSSDDSPNWGPAVSDATCAGKPVTIAGTAGADKFTGTSSADVIAGLGGADKIDGLEKGDRICGGPGPDTLRGRSGDDVLLGGGGDDGLRGHEGDDLLSGGSGDDGLSGQKGNDRCRGGSGEDVAVACEDERGTE